MNNCNFIGLMTEAEAIAAYVAGASTTEIAKCTGESVSTVRRRMIRNGVMRSVKDACAVAASHGRMGRKVGTSVKVSAEGKKNIAAARKLYLEINPPAGTSVKPSGYVEYTTGKHKHKREHRVIAERMLGRPLSAAEVVHHKDGNKLNNAPSNLEVMTWREHSSLHASELHKQRTRNQKGQFA